MAGVNFAATLYRAGGNKEVVMSDSKITRKEFLKAGLFGIVVILIAPVLRLFNNRINVSHKNAGYYKNLAG